MNDHKLYQTLSQSKNHYSGSYDSYSYESCPTESSVYGTLLYISNHRSYNPRRGLCIYKSTEFELTVIEILNPKKLNVIVSCIYLHPHMNLD